MSFSSIEHVCMQLQGHEFEYCVQVFIQNCPIHNLSTFNKYIAAHIHEYNELQIVFDHKRKFNISNKTRKKYKWVMFVLEQVMSFYDELLTWLLLRAFVWGSSTQRLRGRGAKKSESFIFFPSKKDHSNGAGKVNIVQKLLNPQKFVWRKVVENP